MPRPLHDALFWTGCILCTVNRLGRGFQVPFLRGYFNDLWLIPCALPIVLLVHDRMGWRETGPPTAGEIAAHVVGWSVLLEGIGPYLRPAATGDLLDVACYTAGGLVAWAWWHRGEYRGR